MRSKAVILKECMVDAGKNYWLVELLADIRDEQVSLNKTLSAVLAGLLLPAQQGGKR